jgi:tetratricopeptide (TPR) repeat protein
MKSTLYLMTLLFLASCSSSRIDRRIEDVTWDSLADESYLRWGEQRLKTGAKGLDVVKCYQGEAQETLDLYKKEYLTRKDDPYYWLHVGNCYFVEEKWTKAEFFYRQALEEAKLAPVRSIALNNLGLISFKHEQWEKGKEFLTKAIATAPKFKVPKFNLSQLYIQFGFYEKAIEMLNDSVFRGDKDIDVYFSLANAHFYKGELNEARRYFAMIPKDSSTRWPFTNRPPSE